MLDEIEKHDDIYGTQFLYSVYLLTFLFQAKIKIFPHNDPQKNFSWFIDVLFSLYGFLLEQAGKKSDTNVIQAYKNYLLKEHIEVLFMLYYFYQYAAQSLDIPHVQLQQFY
jgi:hypothetical protein